MTAPAPDLRRSVATWPPDPPTSPSYEPALLLVREGSPGLFGPRSPDVAAFLEHPLDPGPPPPPPGLAQAKPGWRTVTQRTRKATKKDASPLPAPTPDPWATWQPDPNRSPSPTARESSPGLFGRKSPAFPEYPLDPRPEYPLDFPPPPPPPELLRAKPGWRTVTPRTTTSPCVPRVQSWAIWQPDPNRPPTPPSPIGKPTLLVQEGSLGLFEPRSPDGAAFSEHLLDLGLPLPDGSDDVFASLRDNAGPSDFNGPSAASGSAPAQPMSAPSPGSLLASFWEAISQQMG
ncbi:hypothetical protein B0H19DRAFT_679463 [Mycena capillaripes]|nr:hypothetical protein B0H19DRAFT_679463 [Mycena capillaripes]